jgi:3',5'-cyclic AMP phosphodiesterase CpdA
VVLVSGDVADDGSVAGYTAAAQRVGRFAQARGIPQVYCPGNHDDRTSFAQVLGSGHLDAGGRDIGHLAGSNGERAAVSEVSGLRVITLDSLVPGHVHGLISDAQLAWLADVLGRPAPAGSVVALHHPPIAVASIPWTASTGLHNAGALGEVLAGRDVRAVLCGHFHAQIVGRLAGVPVSVTPGVVTRMDLTAPPTQWRGVQGAGATVVDLDADGPTFHMLQARDPQAGRPVYLIDVETMADVADEAYDTGGR